MALLFSPQVFAVPTSLHHARQGQAYAPKGNLGQNLNLASNARTISASVLNLTQTVTIETGSVFQSVSPLSLVTAAEAIAALQVAGSGKQSLTLSTSGRAIGGSFTLAANGGQAIANLVIPKNVVFLDDFSQNSTLTISGNLFNAGQLIAVSTNGQITAGTITAAGIINLPGGLISTSTASNATTSLLSTPNGLTNPTLNLFASQSIINIGTIASAGNLTLKAGNSVKNLTNTGANTALIEASNSVNLHTATIINTGIITSLNDNINISAKRDETISLNNQSGSIKALKGAINIRKASYRGNADINVSGGDLLSQNLNVFAGSGTINVNADNISGVVNNFAGAAHVAAAGNDLNLGTIVLSGDPTYYNTTGAVTLSGSITVSGNLAIVADTNIIDSGSSNTTLSTTSNSGNGGNITLIAGAQFTSSGPASGSNDATSTLSISGGSSTGGQIDLTLHSILNSTSTSSGGNGGNITLVAFSGTGSNAGNITLSDNGVPQIRSWGDGTGSNGNVLIIAGATSGSAVSVQNLQTTGGTGGGGNIEIYAATPVIAGGTMSILNGTVTGSFTDPPTTFKPASISTGTLVAFGNITVEGDGAITTSTITGGGPNTTVQLLANGASGNITATAITNSATTNSPGNGGTIILTAANGTITTTNLISNAKAGGSISNANGGTIDLTANSSSLMNINNTSTIAADSVGTGFAGNVSFTNNGGAITIADNLTLTGATASGTGNITISATGGAINTANLSATGNVTLTSNNAITTGTITGGGGGTTLQITATGSSGDINIGNVTNSATNGNPGDAGNITITAANGTVVSANIKAAAATGGSVVNGNGGNITVEANSTTLMNINNAATITATGVGTGTAGNIIISNSAGALTIADTVSAAGATASGTGNITVSAIGGTITTANLTAAGNVTVSGNQAITLGAVTAGGPGTLIEITATGTSGDINTGALTNSATTAAPGSAGNITVTANEGTIITGNLRASAVSSGSVVNGTGGTIQLTANSTSDLEVNSTGALTASGVGNGQGGTINLTNEQGAVDTGNGITATGGASGNGGTVIIEANSTTNFLSINFGSTPNMIGGVINAAAGSTAGNGGTIQLQETGTNEGIYLARGGNTDLSVAGSSSGGNGGTITLDATNDSPSSPSGGPIVFNNNNAANSAFNVSATGTNFNGGTVTFIATSYTNNNAALTINANGTGNGSGGTVNITTINGNDIAVGTAGNNFIINATGGTTEGNGGIVNITSGRSATIAVSSLNINPQAGNGNGGQLTIIAGNNTAGTLTVSGTTTVALNGIGSGTGGVFSATELAAGGVLVLSGFSTITTNGGTTGNGGQIALSAPTMPAGAFTLNANSGTTSGAGGQVSITTTAASGSNISVASTAFSINAEGSTSTATSTNGGGTVTISSGSSVSITTSALNVAPQGGNGNGGQLSVTAGTAAAGDITITGAFSVSGIGSGEAGSVTVNQQTASSNVNLNGGATISAYSGSGASAETGTIIFSTPAGGTGAVNVSSGEIIQGDAIAVNTSYFVDNGTLTSSTANATITILSTGALTLSGSPQPITITGGGTSATITVAASGANALDMNSAYSFGAGGSGSVILTSPSSGGSIVFGASLTQTVTTGSYFGVASPNITFNAASAITASGASLIDIHSGPDVSSSLAQIITLPDSATGGTINITTATGGSFQVGPYYQANLTITKLAGTHTAALNFAGGPVSFYSNGGNTTIGAASGSNVQVTSNNNITFNLGGGQFNDNGTINSTAIGGNITISSSNNNLTLAGTPQNPISVTGAGAGSISLLVPNGTLTLSSSYTFNPGAAGGNTDIQAAAVTISGASTSLSSGNTSSLEFDFLTALTFQASGQSISAAATAGSGILMSGSSLVVTTPDNSSATMSTSGGVIKISGTTLQFSKSSGANTTTLNLNGGNLSLAADGGDITIDPKVTVSSNKNITTNIYNGNATINGILTSTNSGGSIQIFSAGSNASFTLGGTTAGQITVSGSGGTISITNYQPTFNISNNFTLNPGNSGSVSIAGVGTIAVSSQITVNSSSNTASLSINSPYLSLANSALITDTDTAGTAVSINSPLTGGMTIAVAPGGSGTISATGGGNMVLTVFGPLTFAQSGTPGTTLTTINLNAGTGTVTANASGSIVINPYVNVNSNSNLTFNVTNSFVNVNNNGEVQTSTGSISLIAASGTLNIGNNAVVFADQGNLVIENNNTFNGAISVGANANIEAFSSTAGQGNVDIVIGTIPATPVAGIQPANTLTNITGGGAIYWGQNSISASAPNNTINALAAKVIFNTGSQGPTAISLGGGVTITADPPASSDSASAYPGPSVLPLNVGTQALFSQSATATSEMASGLSAIIATTVEDSLSSAVNQFDINYRATNPDHRQQGNKLHDLIADQLAQTKENKQALKANSSDDDSDDDDTGSDDSDDQSTKATYMPIAYYPQGNDKPDAQISELETDTCLIKTTNQSRISMKTPGVVAIKKGEALICASKQTVIQCGGWQMSLAKDSVCLISKQKKLIKVRNLYEHSPASLRLTYQNKQLSLSGGQAIVAAEDEAAIKDALEHDPIPRRKVASFSLGNDQYVATCEFSLVSLLPNQSLVDNVLQSKDSDDQAIAQKLYKMAACVMLVTYGHGAYSGGLNH
jgi:hypothetical protein